MDSAAKMKALSLQIILLLVVARSSICNAQTPASVPSGVKTLSAENATDFSCLNRTFDMYFPNIETGCQKFHLCTKTDGDEVLNLSFMCPEGTSFDFRSADCQSAETVTCKPENGGIRAVRKVSKQLKNKLQLTQPKTSFKCRGKKLGTYYADVETNCTTFHLCTMGEFKSEILDFQFMCLEGTLFDEQWLQCRPESLTACGKLQPKVPLFEKPAPDIPVASLTGTPLPAQPLQEALPVHQPPTTDVPATPQPITTPQEPLQTPAKLPEPQAPIVTVGPDYLNDFNASEADYDYYEDTLALPVREKRSAVPVTIQRIMSVNSEHVRVKRVPPPNFTMGMLPITSFSCADKVPGGYYADVEAGCQLYHVCAPGADGAMRSTKFLCGNNTIFSQQTRTCQIWYTVDCDSTPQFFTLNEELSRVLPEATSGSSASQQQQQQQQAFRQSSALPDFVPTRGSSSDARQFSQPRQPAQQPLSDGFDTFIGQPPLSSEPEFAQQPQVEDQQLDFASRFQQLPEVQRTEDAARDNVASRPARRRKQKRRRKQRPTPQPQPDIPDPFQQELLGLGIPAQSPFEGVFAQRPAARVPTSSSDSRPVQPQQITEPQDFNIPDHVPGLLEEIQVRGRFQQTEDDLIREAAQQVQPRRNPPQRVRLQQQESIEVRVPTAQRVAPIPTDAAFGSLDVTSSQVGQPALPPSSQPTQPGGAIFEGFDAFIQAAIQQEHEQRAKFGPILEQRRLEEEAERQREEQRQTPRQRKRPRTTTARPVVSRTTPEPQVPFSPQQEFQPAFALAAEREPQQSVTRFPDFPTRAQRPSQPPVRRDPVPVQVQNQGRIALIQTVVPRPVVNPQPQPLAPQRQNFQPVPQPASNFNGFIFQQFAQRPQAVSNPAAGLRDFVFLVPSESELLPSTIIQPRPVARPPAPARIHVPQSQSAIAQGQSQFLAFAPQALAPAQDQRQILSFAPQAQAPAQDQRQILSFAPQAPAPAQDQRQILSFAPQAQAPAQDQRQILSFAPQAQAPAQDQRQILPFAPQAQAPAQDQSQFLPFASQAPAPAQGQSQLLRFETANSSGFEIRTRFRRQTSLESLKEKTSKDEVYPTTPFSCKGKVLGGYYADTYTNCNMFHICTSGRKKGLLYDFRFWCANGTVFDQRSQTCGAPEKVNCDLATKYYPTHPLPAEPDVPVPNAELMKIRIKRAVKNVLAIGPNDPPASSFRCAGRDANRYYADAETNCQVFHLCAENGPGGRLADYPFFCRNGTVFDQRAQACDDQTDALNCQDDPPHYGIGEVFGRV